MVHLLFRVLTCVIQGEKVGQELQGAVRALLDVGHLVSLGGWSLVLAIALGACTLGCAHLGQLFLELL